MECLREKYYVHAFPKFLSRYLLMSTKSSASAVGSGNIILIGAESVGYLYLLREE